MKFFLLFIAMINIAQCYQMKNIIKNDNFAITDPETNQPTHWNDSLYPLQPNHPGSFCNCQNGNGCPREYNSDFFFCNQYNSNWSALFRCIVPTQTLGYIYQPIDPDYNYDYGKIEMDFQCINESGNTSCAEPFKKITLMIGLCFFKLDEIGAGEFTLDGTITNNKLSAKLSNKYFDPNYPCTKGLKRPDTPQNTYGETEFAAQNIVNTNIVVFFLNLNCTDDYVINSRLFLNRIMIEVPHSDFHLDLWAVIVLSIGIASCVIASLYGTYLLLIKCKRSHSEYSDL